MEPTANIKLSHNGSEFLARCNFDSRNIVRNAGFRFNPVKFAWYTNDYRVADRLRDYADANAKSVLNNVMLRTAPWSTPLPRFTPNAPLYYQTLAMNFALSRNRAYLALDPGLGKTIVAAMIAKALLASEPHVFVYLCPPFLKRNVEYEFNKWCPEIEVEHYNEPKLFGNFLILPDSLLMRSDLCDEIGTFLLNHLKARTVLYVDEAHRYKNAEAKRTQALLGKDALVDLFERVIYLSGTPRPNRNAELYPILSKSAPETIDFMTFHEYGKEYCNAYKTQFGWDYSGSSKTIDLGHNIKGSFMMRLRGEVLDLPPKIEELFIVSADMPPEIADMDAHFQKLGIANDSTRDKISEGGNVYLAKYLHDLGKAKVPYATEFVEEIMDNTEESILVFCKHREVITALMDKLENYSPVCIDGSVPVDLRQELVDKFQSGKSRILIGNLQAAGIGFNITKASRVLIVEPDWCPATNDQAVDRAHRHGQKNTVYVQYLVYKNSIDRVVMETVLRKRKESLHV